MPTASHRCSSRRRCGSSVLPALLTSVAMLTPLLCRIRWAERALDPTNAFRTLVPAGPRRGSSVRRSHTAPCRAPLQTCIPTPRTERHTPVPRGDLRSISPSVPTFHGSRPPASKGASNGRWTGHPSSPSIRNYASHLSGESTEPGLRRGRMRTAMRVLVPGSLSNSSSASRACPLAHAPRVHVGERFGAGTRRPLRSTNQSDRRDLRVPCPRTPRLWDSGAIDAARRPDPLYGVLGANDV